jgi:ribosomal protein L29
MNCTSRTVKEELLQKVTTKAFNQILNGKDGFIRQMQENIAKAIMDADTMSPDGIQARLDKLQKELIRKANSKQDYDAIADEIFTLREQKSQAEADTRSREETRKRIAELQNFIGGQQSEITEFDESLVRKLIQQITVYDDHFSVEFKSGITIDIEA